MTTYLRSAETARRLGVTQNTLYAYVSRGRISRTIAADGRTSLFDLDEIDALRERSRRGPSEPPPSIDVRIATAITHLDENGPRYRGIRVEQLLDRTFEEVAELLWTGELPAEPVRWVPDPRTDLPTTRPPLDRPGAEDMIRLALELDADPAHHLDGPDVTRRLLATLPGRCGVAHPTGAEDEPLASALTRIWIPDPSPELVAAVDRALLLLADHELATSTLAVRVATSARATTTMSLVTGLAAVTGDLHGGAATHAHRLVAAAGEVGPDRAISDALEQHGRVPGFGHSIYRLRDPRFGPLLEAIRAIPDPLGRTSVIDQLLAEAGSTVPRAPNIDLAVGALSWVGGFPDDAPLFALARLAGWTAHHLEERGERPLRFRGLAR